MYSSKQSWEASVVSMLRFNFGFTSWKDVSVKINIYASSKCHPGAVLKMVTLPFTLVNFAEAIPVQHESDKKGSLLSVPSLRDEVDKRITRWLERKLTSIHLWTCKTKYS